MAERGADVKHRLAAPSSGPPSVHTALPSGLPRHFSVFSPLLRHPLALAHFFLYVLLLAACLSLRVETLQNHTAPTHRESASRALKTAVEDKASAITFSEEQSLQPPTAILT